MCCLNLSILKVAGLILQNLMPFSYILNHLLNQRPIYILFHAILDRLHDINLNNRTSLNKSISLLKVSFLCIIRNIPQATLGLMLSVFLAFQLKGQDCNNLSKTNPNPGHHTFIQLVLDKEVISLIVFY